MRAATAAGEDGPVQLSVRRPETGDVVVAVVLLAVLLPVSVGLARTSETWVLVLFAGLAAVLAACLTWRRVHPTGAFRLAALAMLGLLALPNLPDGPSFVFVPLTVVYFAIVYTVVAETGALLVPTTVSLVGLGLIVLRTSVDPPEPLDGGTLAGFLAAAVGALAATVAFAAYHRARRELRERRLREGVQQERELLAREVHDVVAHSLAVMVAQSDAALMVLDRDPEKARDMVGSALATGRDAMAEMRSMVAHLRSRPASTAPVQGLDDLAGLVQGFRTDAFQVELERSGLSRDVEAGTARAAYRIVQESLTNALKHAHRPVRCTVQLQVASGRVDLTVRDDGPGFRPEQAAPGHGLVGMRERARSVGGQLEITSDSQGTQVRAVLPG
jgi:signal transduction histidine kinase